MTYAWRETVERTETNAWGTLWGIDAPWAHPIWSQYALYLYDVTTPVGTAPPVIHLPRATHEFLLYALDPSVRLERDVPISRQRCVRLNPPNYGYQLRAADNDAARDRVQRIVDEIVAERLSPDTDWRSRWDAMMPDAFPMVRSAFAELFGAPGATN